MVMENKILFIQTGGTIDKDYPRSSGGWAFEFGEPATHRILDKLNPSFSYEVLTAFQKDSLEVKEADRLHLMQMIQASAYEKIIITHGTDTLLETAHFLDARIKDKVIVLTGAMRPERFSNSDAPVNLGMAIAGVQMLKKPAVLVCMCGIIKAASQMKRNLKNGRFY